jgi:hypothetical protein
MVECTQAKRDERLLGVQDAVGVYDTIMSPSDDIATSEQTCQFRLLLNSDSGGWSNDFGSIDGVTILFLEVLRLGYQSGGFPVTLHCKF